VLLVLAGLVVGTGAAHSAAVEQTCVGTEVTGYDPPLTLTPRLVTVTVNGIYPNCTDAEAFNGTYTETFALTASCLTLADSGSTTRSFVWGDPAVAPSTFEYNVTASAVGGQVVVTNTGVITGGHFAPASALQVITLVTPNIAQCIGSGIANVTGPTTLTIYRP
jgi:hypothetical protein